MNEKTMLLILWNVNCHSSCLISKKEQEQFLSLPCQINHCPTPIVQNNLIIQSNHNYLQPMKIQLLENTLNPYAMNNLYEDHQANFSP